MGKFESKFDIYLNTEDPAIVRNMIDKYPFAGVCCNPQMVSRLGRPDFANIVKELREATGERKLFIQTPSNDYDGIYAGCGSNFKNFRRSDSDKNPVYFRWNSGNAAAGRRY